MVASPSNPDGRARIDIHVHLAGSGCAGSGCWLHPELKKRYTIKLLQWFQKISTQDLDHKLDPLWGRRVASLIRDSMVDYGVVLGFDGVADQRGQRDLQRSQLIVPHRWVFHLCRLFPGLLPGPSVNPHLADAMDSLEECIEAKAVLIKWLPSVQLIDPSEVKIRAFCRRLAESGIPLLVHCGAENTFRSLQPELNHVKRLLLPLEEGVKVICAHSASHTIFRSEDDQLPALRQLLKRYPDLWVDNSGLCNPSRFMHVPQLARDPLISSRTLYGSDWPVPVHAFYYVSRMGLRKVCEIQAEKNWITRDIRIKEFFGYPSETLTRAWDVLANLDAWILTGRSPDRESFISEES